MIRSAGGIREGMPEMLHQISGRISQTIEKYSLCSGLPSQISSSFEVTVTVMMRCKKANALP